MRNEIRNEQYDEERALYNAQHMDIYDTVFAGPADGESVLKEAGDIRVMNSVFSLRYPLWHVKGFVLDSSRMDELTRAAIWYANDGEIINSQLNGIKAVRECENIKIRNCRINSAEFGWKSSGIDMADSEIISEYLFLDSKNITIKNIKIQGKYSFQYVSNLTIEDSFLDTKDAFWHSKDVTVKDSTIKGEYLAWFSEGLTLINCKIIGTQPLCYCKDLKLINCTMQDADFSFEYSEVEADVRGHIDSVKNPRSGVITCDSVGEIIRDNPVMECVGEVVCRNRQ